MALQAAPHDEPVTAADVARAAGVSTATVSRAVNAPHLVAEPTRARVLAEIAALGYEPNAAARTLAGARTNAIGLVIPEIATPFFSALLAGVEDVARARGMLLVVAATEPADVPVTRVPALARGLADGLIVLPDAVSDPVVPRLVRQGVPVVLVERRARGVASVAVDGRAGAFAAVQHLVAVHDRRRVALLAGPAGSEASREREAGWREALESVGLSPDAALVRRGGWSDVDAERALDELLAAGTTFDALFCANDEMAIGAMTALGRAGRRVPGDVAVVGFDDVDPARWVRPPLTTVGPSPRALGRAAAELLVGVVRGGRIPVNTRIPTTLVVRASCGCPSEEA